MNDLTKTGIDDDTQTGRGANRGITGISAAIAATIDEMEPTGKLQTVLEMFDNGTIAVSKDIDKDTALTAVPIVALIKQRLLLRGLGYDGHTAYHWHGDVADAAVVIGNNVSVAELGISAGMLYDKSGEIRLSWNEAEAIKDDEVIMAALEGSSQIMVKGCAPLGVPRSISGLSEDDLLKRGYSFRVPTASGRQRTISRGDISFYPVPTGGYDNQFQIAIVPEYGVAVLARHEVKAGMRTWKFRVIATSTLLRALKSSEVTKMVANWKKWLRHESGKVVQFTGRHGDVSSIADAATAKELAATG